METQKNVYSVVYHSLLIGMSVSCILFGIGVVLQLGNGFGLLAPASVLLFMKVGTVAMVLTPISRVAVSVVAFAIDHDYTFVGVTAFVLVMIVASVLLGMSGIGVRG